jgi:hypothetical protein
MAEDLRYRNAWIDQSYKYIAENIQTEALKPVAESFVYNMRRNTAFLRLPSTVAFFTRFFSAAQFLVMKEELLGKPLIELHAIDDDTKKKIADALADMHKKGIEELNSVSSEPGRIVFDVGADTVEFLLSQSETLMSKSIESLMATVIINTWVAFETLAGDLWEAAINAHPEGLAELKGNIKGNKHKASPESLEDRADKTVIYVKNLKKFGYDSTGKMGTLLSSTFALAEPSPERFASTNWTPLLVTWR